MTRVVVSPLLVLIRHQECEEAGILAEAAGGRCPVPAEMGGTHKCQHSQRVYLRNVYPQLLTHFLD